MHIEIIQHVSFEGPGEIINWLNENKISYEIRRMDMGHPLPQCENFDGLIIMGGPMGIHDEEHMTFSEKKASAILVLFDYKILHS